MRLLRSWVRERPTSVLLTFALATLVAGAVATRVRVDASVGQLLLSNDPLRGLDELAKADFGSDEVVMVAFELGRPFEEADLRKLAAISERAAAIAGVERVRDLTTTEDIRAGDDGIDASRLLDLESLDERLPEIRARVRGHRLYEGILVSEDESVLAMLVYADRDNRNPEALHDLTAAVFGVVDEAAPPWEVHYAGYPVTALEADRIVKRDLALLTPATLLATSAVLFYLTHSWFPMLLLLTQFVWVEVVALAWLVITDTPLNVVVSALPTILMATTSTYVIYLVALLGKFQDHADPGAELVDALYMPVLLSSVSTAIGFVSLWSIGIGAIGDLGSGLAVGITAGAASTLLLLPALVQALRPRARLRHIEALERLALVGVRLAARPWAVVAASCLFLAVAAPGALRLVVHTDTLSYFPEDSEVRVGADFFRDRLSSGFLLNVVLRSDEPGRVLDPQVLELAESLIAEIEASPVADRTVSMLDYFYMMDAAMRPNETPRAVPASRERAAQYLLAYESGGDPEDFARYINYDRSALGLLASVHGGTDVYLELARRIDELASELRPGDVTVDTLGSTFLYARAMDQLTRGMIAGLTTAGLLIGLLMLIGLRSLRLAIVAAIPNVLPILICGGAAGWLGIPLSMGTSLVGCVALGLAVDDTTHVLGHLHRDQSLERLYRFVGPGVVLTTVCLGVGFSTMMLSGFESIQALGAATAVTLLVALGGDLILLPSMLAIAGYRRLDDETAAAFGDSAPGLDGESAAA